MREDNLSGVATPSTGEGAVYVYQRAWNVTICIGECINVWGAETRNFKMQLVFLAVI